MKRALIGYTGFVGSNIAGQAAFDDFFRRENIADIAGRSFDLVVCAGVYAEKWRANQNPEADWLGIESLLARLQTIKAKTFVLISTVDVYPNPVGVDEDAPIAGLSHHPYGAHRFKVEQIVAERFSNHHIIRLPGLFGPGLKKNVIYDLLHDNRLDAINPGSVFQYYDLANIWADISMIMKRNIRLINFATEPIPTAKILERLFPQKRVGQHASPPARYDVRTKYAALWGQTGSYIADKTEIMRRLDAFIRTYPPR